MKLKMFAFAILALASNALHAASFSAFATTATCADGGGSTNAVAAVCPDRGVGGIFFDAIATSEPGRLSVGAESGAIRSIGVLTTNTGRAVADASYRDTLSFSSESGVLRLEFDILGDAFVSFPGIGPASFSIARASYVFETADMSQSFSFVAGETLQLDGFSNPVRTHLVPTDKVGCVEFSYTDGTLDLVTRLAAESFCRSAACDFSCLAVISFENSLRFTGSTVFDSSGEGLPFGFLSSTSGFDYSVGFIEHDRGSPPEVVPLPASGFLLFAS